MIKIAPKSALNARRSRLVKRLNVARAPGLAPMAGAAYFLFALLLLAVAALGLPYWNEPSKVDGELRVWVFVVSLLALLGLLLAVGVGITGKRTGVLWSNRNTYSLSRLQVVMWTWLVLSALLAVTISRAWGLFGQGASSGLPAALNIFIPSQLLTVMGISIASSAAAPTILSLKSQNQPPSQSALDAAAARTNADVHAVGSVYVRPDECPPMIKDLFQSDDASAAGTVDVSKVQQFAVTVILWAVYLGMLVQLMFTGVSGFVPDNLAKGTTGLPALSDSFVYLLGISHAGYLAYKAAPMTQPAAGNAPGTPPSGGNSSQQPASALLPRPLPPKTLP